MKDEIFLKIKNYENLYEVSNLGNVRNCVTGKILVPWEMNNGYLQVTLCKNGERKKYLVHRLVASAFIKNPAKLPQVNHRNEIKTDNVVTNLEWCTSEYNNNYGTKTERTSKKVICLETGKIYSSIMEAERQTGIHNQSISACCLGKRNRAGKFHWHYVD